MSSLDGDFDAVLKDLKKRLTEKELEDFESTTLQNVHAIMRRIQNAQHINFEMKDMTRLQSFLEAMREFGEVIEVFLNVHNAIAFIWGPLKFMLLTASTWADSLETLLDAYQQIGEHMPLLKQYQVLFEQHPETRKVLCLVYQDVLEFHGKALRVFSTKVWKQIFRSVWKDFNTRFRSILDRLERHRRLLAEQALAVSLARTEQHHALMLNHVEQYNKDRELQRKVYDLAIQFKSERDFEQQKAEEQEKRDSHRQLMAVLEWLAASQTLKSDHESYRAARTSTKADGTWFLVDSQVQNWIEEDPPVSSTLWVWGIPGAGKTVLASTVIDHCLNSQSGCVTAYFYCREGDPERNTCLMVCRALLGQILRNNRDLLGLFDQKRISSGEVVLNSNTLAEQVLRLICIYLTGLSKDVRLIIDGVDECEEAERKSILTLLTQIVTQCDSQHPGKLRLLVLSQGFDDIKKIMSNQSCPSETLELGSEHVQGDLCLYVSHRSDELVQRFGLSTDQVDRLIQLTCARANGMFLFAKLIMDHLADQVTTNALCDEIRDTTFPTKLKDVYERIIERIRRSVGDDGFKTSRHLLGWLVCAKRPLKWGEIQAAMSINTLNATMDVEGRKLRKNIRNLCGSLVTVSRDGRIDLVHSTAKEHIAASEHMNIAAVEYDLTALAFRYLVFPCFQPGVDEDVLKDYVQQGYLGFQDYAISKWPNHVKAIVDSGGKIPMQDQSTNDAIIGLVDAAEDFITSYPDSFEYSEHPEDVLKDCKDLEDSHLFDYLLDLWTHVQGHVRKGPSSRNDVSIETLATVLSRNRKCLEDLSAEADTTVTIKELYGDRLYKCPKLTCFYFYHGFLDGTTRDQHVRKHNRPYQCEVPTCTISVFGFTTNNDLEKHIRQFHPQEGDLREVFPVHKPDKEARWACEFCNKRFTRNFHLKSHRLSHKGDRPYVCPECGKAFTRANDCKRHEKIHARR